MAPVRMTHKPSLSQSVFSMALPLFSDRICAVLARVTPMANACSLPACGKQAGSDLGQLLSGGCFQRQITPQATPGCGQPRPISRLGRMNAGRHIGLCFPHGFVCPRRR